MSFSAINSVTVGAATKKDHHDRVHDNTVALYAGEMSLPSQGPNDFVTASSSSQLGRVDIVTVVLMAEGFGG